MKTLLTTLVAAFILIPNSTAAEWRQLVWENAFGPAEPSRGVVAESVDGRASLVFLRMPRLHHGDTVDVHLAVGKKGAKRIERLRAIRLVDRPAPPIKWNHNDNRQSEKSWYQDGGLRFVLARKHLDRWSENATVRIEHRGKAWEFDVTGIRKTIETVFRKAAPPPAAGFAGRDDISPGRLVHQVPARYPRGEFRNGWVCVQIVIGKDGIPRRPAVWYSTLTSEAFWKAAVDTALQSLFQPTMLDGEPVESYTEVLVSFGVDDTAGVLWDTRGLEGFPENWRR